MPQANQIFFTLFKGETHNPLCPRLLPGYFFASCLFARKTLCIFGCRHCFHPYPLFPLQKPMPKQKRPLRQSDPAPTPPRGKTGKKSIRKLTASDDLGVLFSRDREDGLPDSFADALAHSIPATTLAEILTEKEELPTPAQSLQAAIRNSPPPQDRIDLHGCTAAEAETKTENFLSRAFRNHLKTVTIITGKGLHSPEGSVLKDVIEARLKIMKSDGTILAYLWEKKDREKSGALLVYLP